MEQKRGEGKQIFNKRRRQAGSRGGCLKKKGWGGGGGTHLGTMVTIFGIR